jgi:hypothetical protein
MMPAFSPIAASEYWLVKLGLGSDDISANPFIPTSWSDLSNSWAAEETDETCCAFGVARQFGKQFIPGETWR